MNGWQPIETAPTDGQWILGTGLCHGRPPRYYVAVRWHENAWREDAYDGTTPKCQFLTHWTPLPEPPEGARQEGEAG